MKPFSSVGKRERVRAIEMGLVRRVARKCKVTKATVSRTFANLVPRPNPQVVAEIRADLERIRQFFESDATGARRRRSVSPKPPYDGGKSTTAIQMPAEGMADREARIA